MFLVNLSSASPNPKLNLVFRRHECDTIQFLFRTLFTQCWAYRNYANMCQISQTTNSLTFSKLEERKSIIFIGTLIHEFEVGFKLNSTFLFLGCRWLSGCRWQCVVRAIEMTWVRTFNLQDLQRTPLSSCWGSAFFHVAEFESVEIDAFLTTNQFFIYNGARLLSITTYVVGRRTALGQRNIVNSQTDKVSLLPQFGETTSALRVCCQQQNSNSSSWLLLVYVNETAHNGRQRLS